MIKIRKATIKDADEIAKVLKESYNIKSISEGKRVFLNEVKKDHNYIIAIEKGKVLGIVTWTIHDIPRHQLAELNRIAVLPEAKGKGIAQLLFAGLIKDTNIFYKKNGQKLRKLYLLTHATNERAQKFYEKLGFSHETTLKNHYYKDVDEWVYSMFF